MNKLLKIDNIMFRVLDIQSSARFYEEVLGLKRVWTDEERCMIGLMLANSDAEIVIHSDPTLPKTDYSFLVDDVAAFCKGYIEKGYTLELGPIDVRCGKFAVLLDPDANRIPIIDLTAFGGKPRYDEQ